MGSPSASGVIATLVRTGEIIVKFQLRSRDFYDYLQPADYFRLRHVNFEIGEAVKMSLASRPTQVSKRQLVYANGALDVLAESKFTEGKFLSLVCSFCAIKRFKFATVEQISSLDSVVRLLNEICKSGGN